MLLWGAIGGIGNGAPNSVDQALNYGVFPLSEAAAKDLGMLNMANASGQILDSLRTSLVVSLTARLWRVFLIPAAISDASAAVIYPIKKAK